MTTSEFGGGRHKEISQSVSKYLLDTKTPMAVCGQTHAYPSPNALHKLLVRVGTKRTSQTLFLQITSSLAEGVLSVEQVGG